jgi:hypothetical protein
MLYNQKQLNFVQIDSKYNSIMFYKYVMLLSVTVVLNNWLLKTHKTQFSYSYSTITQMPAILKYFANQLLRTPAAFSKTKNDVSPESQLFSDVASPVKDI